MCLCVCVCFLLHFTYRKWFQKFIIVYCYCCSSTITRSNKEFCLILSIHLIFSEIKSIVYAHTHTHAVEYLNLKWHHTHSHMHILYEEVDFILANSIKKCSENCVFRFKFSFVIFLRKKVIVTNNFKLFACCVSKCNFF